MKILLVGVSAEPQFIASINAVSRPDSLISVAATKFTRLVLDGFRHHLNSACDFVLLVPVGMYPASRVRWWKPQRIGGRYYLPFLNFMLLKQISIAVSLSWYIIRWSIANRGEKRVVVFTCIYLPFLAAMAVLKRLARLRVAAFVPDLPEFEFGYTATESPLKRALVPAYIAVTSALSRTVDYFVFLTEAMQEKFPSRSYEVIEGLADPDGFVSDRPAPTQVPSVMYSGSLFEKFGIRTLIDAFRSLPGEYELWLFGLGDMTADARRASEVDPRIRVFGMVPNEEVLSYQRRATVLVDPRPASSEFTRYSFPSKILEYMSSGRPVLTARLPGIPADYNDKLWFIEDESVEGMRRALERALGAPEAERAALGGKAAEYVRMEKTSYRRIGDLISRLEVL